MIRHTFKCGHVQQIYSIATEKDSVIQASIQHCFLWVRFSKLKLAEELSNFSQLFPWTFRKITCCKEKEEQEKQALKTDAKVCTNVR